MALSFFVEILSPSMSFSQSDISQRQPFDLAYFAFGSWVSQSKAF
jgi:hypothetical protein